MLCAAYSRPQEQSQYSILWLKPKLKRSSNNLWQLKKVERKQQRVAVARRPPRRAAARRPPRKPARRSNSVRQPTTATFHRRTQHTWPLEAILKGTANASTKPAVPFFFFCLRRSAHLVMLTNYCFEFRVTSFEFSDLSQLETQSER
jgi:hypothetical protein